MSQTIDYVHTYRILELKEKTAVKKIRSLP